MLQNKDNTSFVLSKANILGMTSNILKINNLIDPDELKTTNFDGVLEDIVEEFVKFGKMKQSFIVKKEKTAPSAEAGTIFLEYENTVDAERAMNAMAQKRYVNREIRIIFTDEDQFKKVFLPLK